MIVIVLNSFLFIILNNTNSNTITISIIENNEKKTIQNRIELHSKQKLWPSDALAVVLDTPTIILIVILLLLVLLRIMKRKLFKTITIIFI